MKKLILLFFLFSILFATCSKKNELRWVNANAGLRLRMEPSTESKQIDLIPDGEQVLFLKGNKEEVEINNIKGRWVNITWNEKNGWVFDGFLSNQNLNRWIITKSGLPYKNRITTDRGIIPFKEKVKLVGLAKLENFVIVNWRGSNVEVRREFLSENIDISYNYPELRKVASKKLAFNPNQKIYPEDMYIEANNWLYHIIYIYRSQDFEKDYLESLWLKDGNSWKQIGRNDEYKFKMFNLDEDDNPDIIMDGGCCTFYEVTVFLGSSDKKLNKIFEASGGYDKYLKKIDPNIISTGKCDKTVIEFEKKIYTFDCKKKKFQQ